jgi:DNA-binding LytR/AlgR family response regulator
MRCIIIDDDNVYTEIISKYIAKYDGLELVNKFSNPTEAIPFLKLEPVDLIFLDIEMPEMTGMEFIAYLKDNLPQVILTTSHTEFAIEAFKYNVIGYLVKPYKFEDFCLAVKKAEEKKAKNSSVEFKEKTLFVKNKKTIVKVNKADIKIIECIGDYVTLHTANKKYIIHSSMKSIESRFSQEEYLRVHRSYIVRIDDIEDIEDDSISIGEKIIPIGKTYKNTVYKKLNII